MRVMLIPPNAAPQLLDIELTLEALQAQVGGWIEGVPLRTELQTDADTMTIAYCNEEGKISNPVQELNRFATTLCDLAESDYIAGNLLVLSMDRDGESCAITDATVAEIKRRWQHDHTAQGRWVAYDTDEHKELIAAGWTVGGDDGQRLYLLPTR